MYKRRKYGQDDKRDVTQTITVQLRRCTKYSDYNYAYFAIPLTNGRPSGQPIRLKFTNIYTPDDISPHVSFNANNTSIIAQVKILNTVNSVILWRFENDAQHTEASNLKEYKLSYHYRFKASAIDALTDYNVAVQDNLWLHGKLVTVSIDKIENDPWYLIEWEKEIHDLGIAKNSKKHFTLKQCDVIGISIGLDPNTTSRILQYCIASMDELCYKYGSTIVYLDPYLKFTIENINQSEFNSLTKTNVSREQIITISKQRNEYFFIGRTELHNHKLFISSRELWDAQNYIVKRLYDLSQPMNTPYYAERELLISYIKGIQPIRHTGYDVIKTLISKKLWYNPNIESHITSFMDTFNIESMDDIQRKAIHTAFNETISIVSGGPGRGKSSCVLKSILYIMQNIYNLGIYDPLSDTYNLDYYTYSGTVICTNITKTSPTIVDTINNFEETGDPVRFVHVLSFTGKAVSRIKEVLNPKSHFQSFEPMTIHRLLMRCKKYPWLKYVPSIIIVDEVSMLSDSLFHNLLKNFKDIKKIILLGDVDQLPPIQPGDLLSELIRSRCLPVTRLVKNYRQGLGSGLPAIADKIIGRTTNTQQLTRIHGGWDHALNVPTKKNKDSVTDPESVFRGCDDCELFGYAKFHSEDDIFDDIANKIIEIRESNDVMVDCVVLTAKRTEVAKLNAKLQAAFMTDYDQTLQSSDTLTHYYEGVKFTFVTGDRVMYLENDYNQEIFNGDVGIVTDVHIHNKELALNIPDSSSDKLGSLDNLQPAYSLTTHKAQGSEYKIVIIYISDSAELLHVDQWLYTAFTRARQKVYIYGYNHEIVSTVLREMKERKTFLKHRLQVQFSHTLNDLIRDELQDTPQ